MARIGPFICLYLNTATDIQGVMDMAKKASYTRVITPVTSPQLAQRSISQNTNSSTVFTRSDLLLSGSQWRSNTILKVGEASECDSRNDNVRKQSVENLRQEIDWAKHLDSIACVIFALKDADSCNLARHLLANFHRSGCVLAEIPIVDKSYFTQKYAKNSGNSVPAQLLVESSNVWRRWNNFRLIAEFNHHFKVALELTPELPNEAETSRWFGEPVELVILSADMFEESNNNNSISLKNLYKDICHKLVIHTRANFAVRCRQDDPWIASYPKCLRDMLCSFEKNNNSQIHECNKIEHPAGLILPLSVGATMNNCSKYEQVMHNIYQSAIQLAIKDREHHFDGKINLIISGCNGWKLLGSIISLIGDSTNVQVFVFEEDPSVRITINETIEHLYADQDITILADAKNESLFDQMDIVVSITSEAVYESQWLKYNFDRVRDYTRPNAILIPRHSSITITPVTSSKVCSYLHEGKIDFKYREATHGLGRYANRAQTVCPLYTRNLYECATSLELFSFNYICNKNDGIQIQSDTRIKRLDFTINHDCVPTGFAAHFQTTLYQNVTLNNRSLLRSDNEHCVPMVYFPLRNPQTLSAQSKLEAQFWLNFDAEKHKHWYEWKTITPMSVMHNLKGEVCSLDNPQ